MPKPLPLRNEVQSVSQSVSLSLSLSIRCKRNEIYDGKKGSKYGNIRELSQTGEDVL